MLEEPQTLSLRLERRTGDVGVSEVDAIAAIGAEGRGGGCVLEWIGARGGGPTCGRTGGRYVPADPDEVGIRGEDPRHEVGVVHVGGQVQEGLDRTGTGVLDEEVEPAVRGLARRGRRLFDAHAKLPTPESFALRRQPEADR